MLLVFFPSPLRPTQTPSSLLPLHVTTLLLPPECLLFEVKPPWLTLHGYSMVCESWVSIPLVPLKWHVYNLGISLCPGNPFPLRPSLPFPVWGLDGLPPHPSFCVLSSLHDFLTLFPHVPFSPLLFDIFLHQVRTPKVRTCTPPTFSGEVGLFVLRLVRLLVLRRI